MKRRGTSSPIFLPKATPVGGVSTPTGMPGAPTPVGGADTPGPVTMNLNPEQARDFQGNLEGVMAWWHKLLGNLHPTSFFWVWEGRDFCLFVAGGD